MKLLEIIPPSNTRCWSWHLRKLAGQAIIGLMACAALLAIIPQTTNADIIDFSQWHLVEDPPHPDFSASANPATATLNAGSNPVPLGTDIGYATIDQNTAATSTAGFVFDPSTDFMFAIDFDLSFAAANGALGLGFGIGEDRGGVNSAGISMITNDGAPFLNFFGAARVNDNTLPLQDTGLAASLTGSLFVEFDSATGDVILGASQTPGLAAPTATTTFASLQPLWNGDDLLVSFFIRSEAIPVFAPNGWEGGDATAVFSNMRVLAGSPRTIPEPSSLGLFYVFAAALFARRRRSATS